VADSGFSNVLDGLQFNAMALAGTQSQGEAIDLTGAAAEVAKFRDCTGAQLS
ncbi:MAG: excinuclease ABC subunit B, partial [Shimia sp.]|nr:excinuclease ABC subunit B [Shimia sp.]